MKVNVQNRFSGGRAQGSGNSINYICTNQDHSYYATSSNRNFYIFRILPHKNVFHNNNRDSASVRLKIHCMSFFHHSNTIGVVLTDNTSEFRLFELKNLEYKKVLTNPQPIIDCKVHENFFVLVSSDLIHVYDNNFRPTYLFKTYNNPRGICEINQDKDIILMAFPDLKRGQVRVHREDRLEISRGNSQSQEGEEGLMDSPTVEDRRSRKILLKAYFGRESNVEDVECIGVDYGGNKVAMVVKSGFSGSGILVYAIDARTGQFNILKMLTRGNFAGEVTSLSFSLKSQFLALSSLSGTLHIYSLGGKYKNPRERFSWNNYEKSLFKVKNLKKPFFTTWQWSERDKRSLLVVNQEEILKFKMNKDYSTQKKNKMLIHEETMKFF